MALIDKTYFRMEINLPDNTFSNLDDYLDRYEQEILDKILGYDLSKLCRDDDSATRVQRLNDGYEYTQTIGSQSYTVKWNGFQNSEQ